MFKEWLVSKEVRDVKRARWEGFKRLAMRLPDHHVLAVELIRTHRDETAAVFTVVRGGEPIQAVVMGDAQGRVKPNQCPPRRPRCDDGAAPEAAALRADGPAPMLVSPALAPDALYDGGAAEPDGVALGDPPVKQPPTPGLIALASTLLAATFDLGEHVPQDA